MNLTPLAVVSGALWMIIGLLPWRPWNTREVLDASDPYPEEELANVTVVVPARNEASLIEATLSGIRKQGRNLAVIVVDDKSTDGTAESARRAEIQKLRIVSGETPPEGWSGKLWALHQGVRYVETPFTLLLDADIELEPGILRVLQKTMIEKKLQFLSLMAAPRMVSFWERLLMPAFVYFFKLLYPFRLSNSPSVKMAAAAGGCILMETKLLKEIGGFEAICGELIDDCALARRVKSFGHRTWIGLTHSVRSLRPYDQLKFIWNMVARTAFTQLRYSTLLLGLCTALMISLFWVPVGGLFFPALTAKLASAVALTAMVLSYLPTLRFYGLSRAWAVMLPLIGTLYLAMTWTSALRSWWGKGSRWKGRSYSRRQEFRL